MSYRRKSGRRVDGKGRSTGGSQHIRLYLFEMQTAAFRSLSVGARALLLELKALYNGNNNGALFLSAREAATPRGTRRVVVMWRDAADPDNTAAIARWCAAHPDEPVPSEDDANVLIVMWVINDPPHRAAACTR